MRAIPSAMLLAAGLQMVVATTPVVAWAQGPQPVPYPNAPPPVPYGQPAPTPSPATGTRAAPAAGSDVIYMKNGGMLRGTIIDAIPGAQARIQLATGEIATVPWQDISRIEHGAEARPSPTPAQQAPAARVQPAPPSAGQMVWVHIEGSDDARLEQDTTGDGGWRQVCTAPCDMQLPNDKDYRITGGGIKNSHVFRLAGHAGDHETLTVSPGSKGWFVMGIVLIPIGGITMFIGLVVGLIASAANSIDPSQSASSAAAGGWTAFALGAAGVVGGIILVASNAKTGVSQDVAAAQTGLLLRSDAWKSVPRPTWKDASPLDKAMPPVVGMPLFTGSF